MAEHVEARVVVKRMPNGIAWPRAPAPFVARNTGDSWHVEAPLDAGIISVVAWLLQEPLLHELPPGASLSIEHADDGRVTLQLIAPRPAVERFIESMREHVEETRLRRFANAEDDAPALTAGQADALRRAVALGYYEIPRSIHLSELAAKLGVSPAALSERLRRAEARLVTHYVTRGPKAGEAGEK